MITFIFKNGARSDADVAASRAFATARLAQANSVAKIASPMIKTAIPGPGVTMKRIPMKVTIPPMKPMKRRHASFPAGVALIHVDRFLDCCSVLSSPEILSEVYQPRQEMNMKYLGIY